MLPRTSVPGNPGSQATKTRPYVIGLEVGHVEDIQKKANQVLNICYQLICANPRRIRTDFSHFKLMTKDLSVPVFPWNCLQVSENVRTSCLVGVLSNYAQEVKNDILSRLGERILLEELRFFKYFGVSAILIDLHENGIPQIASLLLTMTQVDSKHCKPLIWVRFKLGVKPLESESNPSDTKEGKSGQYPMWEKLMALCDQDEHIYPVLELTPTIPSEYEVQTWIRDKVSAVFIPTDLFTGRNKNGHPVLPPRHVEIIQRFLSGRTPQYFIKDVNTETETPESLLRGYRRNIEVIFNKWEENQKKNGLNPSFSLPLSPGSLFARNYQPRMAESMEGLVMTKNPEETCQMETEDYSRFLNDD